MSKSSEEYMQIADLDEFLKYYANLRDRTKRVIAVIPPEKFEWAPGTETWTLGNLVRHLAAIERYMYAETIQGHPHRYRGCAHDLADGYAASMQFMDRLHAESMAIFAALSPEQLNGKCNTPAGSPITVWKWLRAMCEHEIHHRGQIYTYLGILGVKTPPLYGLTSEQVAETATGSIDSR
jgi:uncharacterized damage-inducible protein DinB